MRRAHRFLSRVLAATRAWEETTSLSDNTRSLNRCLRELAAYLSTRPYPDAEVLESVRILGCALCKRTGQCTCDSSGLPNPSTCFLGFH